MVLWMLAMTVDVVMAFQLYPVMGVKTAVILYVLQSARSMADVS